jgi:hypothetical protein
MSTSSYLSSRFAPIPSFLSGSLVLARTSWSVVSSCHPPDDRLEADLTLRQHACLSLLKGGEEYYLLVAWVPVACFESWC